MLREGLKQDEVFQIVRQLKAELEEGKEPEIAFAAACRVVVGVSPETLKNWKKDIFALHEGKPTVAGHAPQLAKGYPGTGAQRIRELTETNAKLQVENTELKEAVTRLLKEKSAQK